MGLNLGVLRVWDAGLGFRGLWRISLGVSGASTCKH